MNRILFGILLSLLGAASGSAFAQCEALTRGGLFEQNSLKTDDERATSFVNWARDRRSNTSSRSSSLKGGFDYIDILKADADSKSANTSDVRQDVENYNSGDAAMKKRVLSYASTVSKALVDGFNDCMKIKGLHVWIETTPLPNTFKIAMTFNSPGTPTSVAIQNVSTVPRSPSVTCDKVSSRIGGSVLRLTCQRKSCEAVAVTVNSSDSDPIGGGTLGVPATPPCSIDPTALANEIQVGKTFTVTFDKLLGNIGTIHPNRALVGTYSQGEKVWRVDGPNDVDGHMSKGSLYGCGAKVPPDHRDADCIAPLQHMLNIWGARFSFNDDGEVREVTGGGLVGRVTAK